MTNTDIDAPKSDEQADSSKRSRKAIDAPTGTFFWLDPYDAKLKIVGLDTKDGPEHRLYDPRIHRPLDENRVRNFRFFGCREPIVVEKQSNGDLYVVDGRGRTRYSREAYRQQVAEGETQCIRIPVLLAKGDEDIITGLANALNLHDADGPVTLARKAQNRLDRGRTLAEVSVEFGVSDQTIRNWQTLIADVAPEVLAKVVAGEITSTAAIALAPITKEQQGAALQELQADGGKVTAEKAKQKAEEKTGKVATLTPKQRLDKIENVLVKLLNGEQTKDALWIVLQKICKLATKKTMEKLAEDLVEKEED